MIEYLCLKNQEFHIDNFKIMPIKEEEIEKIRKWRNEQTDILRQSKHISKDEQINYFNKYIWSQLDSKKPSQILMSFYKNNKFIGYGGLVHISWENYRAEISFLLDTKRMKNTKTYLNDFKNFLELMKQLALSIKMNKLSSETYIFREKHINRLEKSGFEKEGVLKEHILIDRTWFDAVIHGYFLQNN